MVTALEHMGSHLQTISNCFSAFPLEITIFKCLYLVIKMHNRLETQGHIMKVSVLLHGGSSFINQLSITLQQKTKLNTD